ncbi:hypothetical protein FH972_019592 [Carpinus fangiana]|uniref:tRNA dimethylallyltransferase n=1 Tax=Carpinus fangiana TaxID=176857 RepID=A0A5N6RQX6_9ROSI|nr:hypothetical protein FH972_019592 [Carpinus fangiana]
MLSGASGLRACFLRLPYSPERPLLRAATLRFRRRRRVFSTDCAASGAKKQKVIVISGPTGAGKTRLAIELAKRLNGEIISADSVQVYRGLDIGSAKPSPSDRQEIPHHLVDILHPYEELADLQRDEDWDAAVQLVVKAGDPKAQFIAVNDWYRLRRSLEIIKSSGSPPSAFRVPYDSFREQCSSVADSSHDVNSSADALEENESKDLDYDFICFFLSTQRVDLYKSIDYRCEDMLSGSDGILSEARWLLDTGLLPNSNSATRAIGYRQAMEYLSHCRQQGGRSSPGDFFAFLSDFQKASRNFAKRQLTWFRNESIYHWLDASKPLEQVLNFIYDSYHDDSGVLVVPEALRMKKDLSGRRETAELKAYRTRNRHFVSRQDCSDILDWIRRTQG